MSWWRSRKPSATRSITAWASNSRLASRKIGTNQAQGATGVSPRFSLGVTRLNFRGRNHTITFKADVGSLQQRGLVSYNAPRWFNSPAWKLSLTAFYDNTLDVTTFTSQRLEGSVQAEEIVSRATTMALPLYLSPGAGQEYRNQSAIRFHCFRCRCGWAGPGLPIFGISGTAIWKRTKGSYTTVDAGVASSYFGSEADFSRILVQNSTYHSFGKNRPREEIRIRSFVAGRRRDTVPQHGHPAAGRRVPRNSGPTVPRTVVP